MQKTKINLKRTISGPQVYKLFEKDHIRFQKKPTDVTYKVIDHKKRKSRA